MIRSIARSAVLAFAVALALTALTAASAFASGPPVVETKSATLVGGTEATLNATVNANGAGTKYHFDYGTTVSYGSKTTEAGVLGSTPVKESKTVTALSTSTTYHFRVVATNANGTSYGADEVFTTTTEKPEFAVTGAKITELQYVGSFGNATWQVGSKAFVCGAGGLEGIATDSKTLQGRIWFTGCRSEGSKCKSLGAKEEEIVTEELQGTLAYISKSAKTVGVVFKPRSAAFLTKFQCVFAGYDEAKGAIILPVGPVNSRHYGFSEGALSETEGKQAISEYENGHGEKLHAALESTWPGGGTFNPLGWAIGATHVETNREVEIQA